MRRCLMLGLLFGLTAAVSATAQTIEEISQKLADAYQKVESLTADFQTTQNMSMGGMESKMDLKGTMEMARQGEKLKFRMEQTGKQSFAGQEQDIKILAVSDGEHTWMLNEQSGGQKMAMKMKADPQQGHDPKAQLAGLKEMGDVTLVGEEELNGAETWVIEVALSGAAAEGMPKQKYWFRKDIGMQVQMTGYDAEGKEIMKSVVTDVKVNPSVDADRFTFTPPEGVQVMDMTNMPTETPETTDEAPDQP